MAVFKHCYANSKLFTFINLKQVDQILNFINLQLKTENMFFFVMIYNDFSNYFSMV